MGDRNMVLNLYWKDVNNNDYCIAILERQKDNYFLYINEKELKSAIRKGCVGIGNINFLSLKYESKELFPFFKNRIPREDNIRIKSILEKYGLKEYDEMELLKVTGGKLRTDRYYLK